MPTTALFGTCPHASPGALVSTARCHVGIDIRWRRQCLGSLCQTMRCGQEGSCSTRTNSNSTRQYGFSTGKIALSVGHVQPCHPYAWVLTRACLFSTYYDHAAAKMNRGNRNRSISLHMLPVALLDVPWESSSRVRLTSDSEGTGELVVSIKEECVFVPVLIPEALVSAVLFCLVTLYSDFM